MRKEREHREEGHMADVLDLRRALTVVRSRLRDSDGLDRRLGLDRLETALASLPEDLPVPELGDDGTATLPGDDAATPWTGRDADTIAQVVELAEQIDIVSSRQPRDGVLADLEPFHYLTLALRYLANTYGGHTERAGKALLALPSGTKLWRWLGEIGKSFDDFELWPGEEDAKLTMGFEYDASAVGVADGIVYGVTLSKSVPPFDFDGALVSGYVGGVKGTFSIDFGKVASTLSNKQKLSEMIGHGPNFYLRITPVVRGGATYGAVGQPSNVIGVYYWSKKIHPAVKVASGTSPGRSGTPSTPKPLGVRMSFDCLQCNDSNELKDEPYLVTTSFSNKREPWQPWYPIPLFTDVTGTSGNWCPVAIIPWGPNEDFTPVMHDEIIGFHVALNEKDNSDPQEVRKTWGSIAKLGLKFFAKELMGEEAGGRFGDVMGTMVGKLIGDLVQAVDSDDFIGDGTRVYPFSVLEDILVAGVDGFLKATYPEDSPGFSKPWNHPKHQAIISHPATMEFKGSGAHYKLHYSVQIMNPGYIGPYKGY
jgi:hypothetical protein